MELAIPLVALGGLYIMSNQSKKSNNENFQTQYENRGLPNIDVPNKNYPNEQSITNVETDLTSKLSTVNKYDTPEVYTDKYFNANMNKSMVPSIDGAASSDASKYYSLTGEQVDNSYFQHNNMVPFFGSHLRTTQTSANSNESILDNYSGAGSQIYSKTERVPLFSPQDNYQWSHGAPNMTDFYQSRVNVGSKMTNVRPFADQKVAPGLGLGYTTEGSGGFNSGLDRRDLYLPKTADELRVANKPKPGEFGLLGHEGPSMSQVTNRGIMGHMEKNRVDTTFELGPERLFTTKGVESAPTSRAIRIDKFVNRPETTTDYTGAAGYSNSSAPMEGEYMPSTNIELGPVPVRAAYRVGGGGANDSDYGIKSKMAYPNNRSSNQQDSYFGAVGGAIGAAVAPLLDMLRPSRKENTIGTLRPYQNPGATVSNSYIFNPADRPSTTIRETTENSKGHLNVNANQRGGAYEVTAHQPINNSRQHTSDHFYVGNGSAGERGRKPRPYDAEYRQRNNEVKSSTLVGFTPGGNMSLMNADMNVTTKPKENYLTIQRPVDGTMPYQSASTNTMGQMRESNGLYANLQMDRNSPDVMSQLKGNPFVVSHLTGL